MKKVFFTFGLGFFAVFLISSGQRGITSNGAPLASTGAPGEHTCAKSGCHTGSGINTGSALLSLNLESINNTLTYQPGQTYNFTVSLTQPGIQRFGFQLAALNDADNTDAGSFIITDSTRTQVLPGVNEFTGRSYATYKYPGTAPYSDGRGQWAFKWTAPNSNAGSITLYAAAVAANNDGTDAGDSVYTTQLKLQQSVTAISGISATGFEAQVFPNPAHTYLQLTYNCPQSGETIFRLTDLEGNKATDIIQRYDDTGPGTTQLDITPYQPGIYLLTILHGNNICTKKIFIQ